MCIQHYTSLLVTSYFFFNDTSTTEIYTLSLHDALPISSASAMAARIPGVGRVTVSLRRSNMVSDMNDSSRLLLGIVRSEEHTSELQSRFDLVCRLLLEKKKNRYHYVPSIHN